MNKYYSSNPDLYITGFRVASSIRSWIPMHNVTISTVAPTLQETDPAKVMVKS